MVKTCLAGIAAAAWSDGLRRRQAPTCCPWLHHVWLLSRILHWMRLILTLLRRRLEVRTMTLMLVALKVMAVVVDTVARMMSLSRLWMIQAVSSRVVMVRRLLLVMVSSSCCWVGSPISTRVAVMLLLRVLKVMVMVARKVALVVLRVDVEIGRCRGWRWCSRCRVAHATAVAPSIGVVLLLLLLLVLVVVVLMVMVVGMWRLQLMMMRRVMLLVVGLLVMMGLLLLLLGRRSTPLVSFYGVLFLVLVRMSDVICQPWSCLVPSSTCCDTIYDNKIQPLRLVDMIKF